jgi:hypothetical protein
MATVSAVSCPIALESSMMHSSVRRERRFIAIDIIIVSSYLESF